MDDIFKILKENNSQPRILYPEKLSFRNEGRIKAFLNKQRVHYHQTCLTRNAKGSYLSGSKRTLINIIKN